MATGEKLLEGLDWKKPKPLASSPGMRLRRLTSLTSISSLTCSSAFCALVPMGTSSVMTATSDSKSMPHSSDPMTMGPRGARKLSEPPWYIRGSCQKLSGISAPRALRTSSTWLT
ncbi:hypothetical protein D3C76_1342500 [compost metagenome]